MLLPQSTAYRTLSDRLATVSTHNTTLLSAAAAGGVRACLYMYKYIYVDACQWLWLTSWCVHSSMGFMCDDSGPSPRRRPQLLRRAS